LSLGIRGKLFLSAAAAVTVLVLVSGLYLEGRLRASQLLQIEADLLRGARAARELVEGAPEGILDEVADRMGEALAARVTIIGPTGVVLGDSKISADGLANLENHADRPEILDAAEFGRGVARRYSRTLDEDMLYLAIPYDHPGGGGFVRVALPLTQVDEAAMRLRAVLAVGGALGLALALLGGGVVSHLLSRDVRALARGRDRFSAVIEGMDAAVMAVDGGRRITLINARATRLLRLPPDADGQPFDQVVQVPDLHRMLVQAEQGETAFEELTLPGNPPRIATVRVTPQRAPGGAVLVMHDITRQQRLETVRRDFVANVSHELRTPVTVIRANAETLLDGAIDDPARGPQFLSAVLRNAERMSQIVSDLLDLTRIESGKLALDIRPIAVHSAASRALDSVAEAAAARSVDVRIDVDDDLRVSADAQALDQILVNLLDNAVKYTPAGGHVVVEAGPRETGVRVEVRDDGPGIEPRHRDRIFERFYRVDKGRSREMGGTGLGLAIVKHLVAALGGEIGVEPADGGGSVFWIILDRSAD